MLTAKHTEYMRMLWYVLELFESMCLQFVLFFFVFFLCIPGDAVVNVIDEVATDLSQFILSTDAVASSGMKITTYHY